MRGRQNGAMTSARQCTLPAPGTALDSALFPHQGRLSTVHSSCTRDGSRQCTLPAPETALDSALFPHQRRLVATGTGDDLPVDVRCPLPLSAATVRSRLPLSLCCHCYIGARRRAAAGMCRRVASLHAPTHPPTTLRRGMHARQHNKKMDR